MVLVEMFGVKDGGKEADTGQAWAEEVLNV